MLWGIVEAGQGPDGPHAVQDLGEGHRHILPAQAGLAAMSYGSQGSQGTHTGGPAGGLSPYRGSVCGEVCGHGKCLVMLPRRAVRACQAPDGLHAVGLAEDQASASAQPLRHLTSQPNHASAAQHTASQPPSSMGCHQGGQGQLRKRGRAGGRSAEVLQLSSFSVYPNGCRGKTGLNSRRCLAHSLTGCSAGSALPAPHACHVLARGISKVRFPWPTHDKLQCSVSSASPSTSTCSFQLTLGAALATTCHATVQGQLWRLLGLAKQLQAHLGGCSGQDLTGSSAGPALAAPWPS